MELISKMRINRPYLIQIARALSLRSFTNYVDKKRWVGKGQLISKAICQAVNSSKKQTNKFVFTTMWHVFVPFLEEIKDSTKSFRNYLTFSPEMLTMFIRSKMSTAKNLSTLFVNGPIDRWFLIFQTIFWHLRFHVKDALRVYGQKTVPR